jgi:hypothetical protein
LKEDEMKKFLFITLILIILFFGFFVLGNQSIDGDKAIIEQVALDYIEGWFEGNAARMERALHPELVKRAMIQDAQGKEYFQNLAKSDMVKATEGGGGKKIPVDERQINITIFDVYKTIATVRVESGSFIDYLHLGKSEGDWKIVNVLWLPNVMERKAVQVDATILEDYVGEYELTPEFTIAVTARDGRIFAQGTGQPAFELFAKTDSQFFLKDVPASLTFVKDDQGKVTHLVLFQGGNEATAKKTK